MLSIADALHYLDRVKQQFANDYDGQLNHPHTGGAPPRTADSAGLSLCAATVYDQFLT